MSHRHSLYDTDPHFVIDGKTRAVTNVSETKTTIFQYDHNSERFTFELPRKIDGHDMTLCDIVQVHYINIGSSNARYSGVYNVTDVGLSPDDSDVMICSWLISSNATQLVGTLNFILRFICSDVDGKPAYIWSTAIHSGVSVASSLSNGDAVVESCSDILLEWESRLFGIGDTEEQKIKDSTEEQLDAISAKGEAVLLSIPEEYSETATNAMESVRTKADAIVQTVEGSAISINNSSNDCLRGLRVFGRTEQVTTTGINLSPSIPNAVTYDGVTFTPMSDGTVIANGTPTTVGIADCSIITLEPGEYIFSGSPVGGGLSTYAVRILNGEATGIITENDDIGEGMTFIVTETDTYRLRLIVRGGYVANGLVFKPMIRLASETDATFEPYTGGAPSPSPDYPQELESLSDIDLYIAGNNLFDPNDTANVSDYVSVSSDGFITFNVPANSSQFANIFTRSSDRLIVGKTYTVKCLVREIENGVMHYMSQHSDLGGSCQFHASRSAPNTGIFTVELPVKYDSNTVDFMLRSYFGITDTTKAARCVCRIWVYPSELGDLEFEPYVPEQTISISRAIPGIPVSSGGNYTDTNGRQWICDEVDFERGVYIQRVSNVRLTSTGQLWKNSKSTAGRYLFAVDALKRIVPLCSHMTSGIFIVSNINHMFNNDGLEMCFNTTYTTMDEWKAFLDTEDVWLQYALATPIETALSDAELNAYRVAHTNHPNSVIFNNRDAHMEVSYNADTKIYLDSRSNMLFTDTITGKKYKLYVAYGKLSMTEVTE